MNRSGSLLVSHPRLPIGHPFRESVIYLYDEAPQATLGIILNYKSTFSVKDLCKSKGIMFNDGRPKVFKGGPVNEQALVMLHSTEWSSDHTHEAGSNYNISSDDKMFEKLASGDTPLFYRVFAGICTWGPGQLDMELKGKRPYRPENSWLLGQSNNDIVFGYEADEQYKRAVNLCSKQMIDQYF